MTKENILEALEFYADNGLDEVIFENSQNHFNKKDRAILAKTQSVAVAKPVEIIAESTPAAPPQIKNNFIKPVFSTDNAISMLAKKAQKNDQETTNNQTWQSLDSGKLISLNDIVARAKSLAEGAKTLEELRQAVENFDGCNLKKMATNTVFCDGNPNSKIMVIGEAPGNHEDLQGIPFCGDSGKVLDAMFRAINMTRQNDFYISNVIFWRPPGNRRPTEEELAICRPFVERHIQLVMPRVVVLVGATAMTALLGINDPISSVRGKFMDFAPKFLPEAIKTFTVFHPSYLMRQSSKKKLAWLDMLNLEKFSQNL